MFVQELNKPGEQRRLKKLVKRRKTSDLRRIIDELREFQVDTRLNLLEAFPPLHAADRSVDTSLCNEMLDRLGVKSLRSKKGIVLVTVKLRRDLM
jgi:hypothetical protein